MSIVLVYCISLCRSSTGSEGFKPRDVHTSLDLGSLSAQSTANTTPVLGSRKQSPRSLRIPHSLDSDRKGGVPVRDSHLFGSAYSLSKTGRSMWRWRGLSCRDSRGLARILAPVRRQLSAEP